MPIAALPQPTIRAIGSTSALSDSCSVVKELIDNSLDASTTSISIEISLNTLDIIQVKDNGHGIQPDDRDLVCRPNFTSKIRTLEDLRNIGGRSLGFRGAALAGVADMSSGPVMVTTRVEGEVVATVMKYGRAGELLSKEKASHARGTTVRVTNFLGAIPVRKQMALKMASKTIAKIKKMLQAYALARPSVRLSFKVLKEKGDAGNWVYGPTAQATIVDAALKVAGQEAASQCITRSWPGDDEGEGKGARLTTASVDGESFPIYKLKAYLPAPEADFQKTSRAGQYISIDGRHVSSSKGVPRDIAKLFKSYLRSLWGRQGSDTTYTDTFLCLHIHCPSGTYDVNIEPAKDDVLFESSGAILSLADGLFRDVYGELTPDSESGKGNNKQQIEVSQSGNAFDLLLSRRPKTAEPLSEPRRLSRTERPAVLHKGPKTNYNSHYSAVGEVEADNTSGRMLDDGPKFATPWTMAKRDIPGSSFNNSQTIPSPSRQLPTPVRERHSPGRAFPTRELLCPSYPPSPSRSEPLRDAPKTPEATPLSAGWLNIRDLIKSKSIRFEDQIQKSPKKGYRDEEIASWVRDSGVHVDESEPLADYLSNNNETTPRPTLSLPPCGDRSEPLARACEKPMNIDGLNKPFKSPLNPRQPGQQASRAINERDTTPRPPIADEGSPHLDSESVQREYSGFERASTLVHDPPVEEFDEEIDAALDFERRKKAAMQARKKQVQSLPNLNFPNYSLAQDPELSFLHQSNQSPHRNRYLAAKSALTTSERVNASSRVNERSQAQAAAPVGLEYDDPRAYYIRNRNIQESPLSKTGLKIRRTQTNKLPLETIPDGSSLHQLALTCPLDHDILSASIAKSRKSDLYIQTGTPLPSGSGFKELSEKDHFDWERKLSHLLRKEYKTEDGNIPADIPLDFKLLDGEESQCV